VRIGCHTGPVFVLLNVFVPNADEAAGNTRSFRVSVPVVGTSTSLSTELRSTTVSQIRVEVVLQSRLESRPLSVSRLIESAVILSSLDWSPDFYADASFTKSENVRVVMTLTLTLTLTLTSDRGINVVADVLKCPFITISYWQILSPVTVKPTYTDTNSYCDFMEKTIPSLHWVCDEQHTATSCRYIC